MDSIARGLVLLAVMDQGEPSALELDLSDAILRESQIGDLLVKVRREPLHPS